MTAISVSKTIKAPPQRVFETLTNFAQLAEIEDDIVSMEFLTDGPVGIGTRYRETRVMFGKEASEEMEITSFDPPNAFVTDAESHGSHYQTAHSIQAKGDESVVTMCFGATPISLFAKIMMFVMGPLMKKSLSKCMDKHLTAIKQHAEGSAVAR